MSTSVTASPGYSVCSAHSSSLARGQKPSVRLCLKEALAQGVADQLGAVVEVELLHDTTAVAVHRLGAQGQLAADLLVGVALGGEAQDLHLAPAQPIKRVGAGGA